MILCFLVTVFGIVISIRMLKRNLKRQAITLAQLRTGIHVLFDHKGVVFLKSFITFKACMVVIELCNLNDCV